MNTLNESSCLGFVKLIDSGISAENDFIYVVTSLLGPSLEDLFHFCGKQFSLKTTLMVFYQVLDRIEHIQGRGYIHLDIKPANLLMGLENAS